MLRHSCPKLRPVQVSRGTPSQVPMRRPPMNSCILILTFSPSPEDTSCLLPARGLPDIFPLGLKRGFRLFDHLQPGETAASSRRVMRLNEYHVPPPRICAKRNLT